MRKKIIFTLLLTLLTVGSWADDAKIIVWLNDGNKTEILFNEMPEFLYADGNISLQNGSTTLSWPLSNLQKFTFEDIVSSVPTVPTDIKEVKKATLDLLSDHCSVYDLNGKLIRKQIKSLSELPKGVYIVKDGNVSIKVVRK